MRLALASVLAAALVCACQLPGGGKTCTSQIDWVDFVEIGSTQYVAADAASQPIRESDLGPVYAHVKHELDGNVCDPNYHVRNGDAAFLPVGTAVFRVNGHSPSERLAAHRGHRLVMYVAHLTGPSP